MSTSPEEVVAQSVRLAARGEPPKFIRWEATPQGEAFWRKFFLHGDKRGNFALERLLKQATRDAMRCDAGKLEKLKGERK